MKTTAMLLMGIVTSFCFTVNAQTVIGAKQTAIDTKHTVITQTIIGIKGGVNIDNLSEFNGRSRISGHGGIFINHTINKNFSFQPELLYSAEGQRFYSNAMEHTLALDYLQLPLMIQYYPVPELYIEAGPQVGLLISAQDKVDQINGHSNVRHDYASAQLAISGGVGIRATDQIIVYGRYNFGLTDVTVFDNIVDHSRVGQIGLAVRFNH